MISEAEKEIQRNLLEICEFFEKEESDTREAQIRLWKSMKYYWNGFQKIWWDEVAHDWQVYDEIDNEGNYDKPVNIFKAYLESIIAALSVAIPSIKCFPDDADNSLDISTAKAGDKIGELVYKHNDAPLLWIHALYIYCTEGLIAAYNYKDENEKYGTYEVPTYESMEEEQPEYTCPNCGNQLNPDKFAPGNEDVDYENILDDRHLCQACAQIVDPTITVSKVTVQRIVGKTTKPKARQCVEVYGGLHVKIPNYAKKQEDIPYLRFAYETHYSMAMSEFPDLKDEYGKKYKPGSGSGSIDYYERWGRLSPQYGADEPRNITTIRKFWLRPAAFNILNDDKKTKQLLNRFPDGAKVCLVNDLFGEAENACLDDAWTLTHNPLSDYLHHDPLGMVLTSIQEITNELVSLVLMTIEHGIPQTFADPNTLDFKQYGKTRATPGSIYPVKVGTGTRISDKFYEVKTASLSAEVLPFSQMMQEMGQMTSGALPSLFGGAQPNSSKTAAQYSMSKAQALQRLQTTWKMLSFWWKNIFGKVIPAYIKDIEEDEKIVQKDELGNFVNVFVRKAELQGKIGSIELEANENLPSTWSQRKDTIMSLMNLGNPEIMKALMAPENVSMLAESIGLTDFNIPDQDSKQKQTEEIMMMMEGASQTDMNGAETSSVEVDQLLDDHIVEAAICRHWLISEVGRLAKQENPEGYRNILIHFQQHMQFAMPMAQNQVEQPQKQRSNINGTGNPAVGGA